MHVCRALEVCVQNRRVLCWQRVMPHDASGLKGPNQSATEVVEKHGDSSSLLVAVDEVWSLQPRTTGSMDHPIPSPCRQLMNGAWLIKSSIMGKRKRENQSAGNSL